MKPFSYKQQTRSIFIVIKFQPCILWKSPSLVHLLTHSSLLSLFSCLPGVESARMWAATEHPPFIFFNRYNFMVPKNKLTQVHYNITPCLEGRDDKLSMLTTWRWRNHGGQNSSIWEHVFSGCAKWFLDSVRHNIEFQTFFVLTNKCLIQT